MSRMGTVEFLRLIQAPCAAVFRAWADPETLRRWLVPGGAASIAAAVDFRVGGAYRIETQGRDGARHVFAGRYRELVPDRRIVKSWTYEGPAKVLCGMETLLTVALTPVGEDATELRLTHSRIGSEDARSAYLADWPGCLDDLRRLLQVRS